MPKKSIAPQKVPGVVGLGRVLGWGVVVVEADFSVHLKPKPSRTKFLSSFVNRKIHIQPLSYTHFAMRMLTKSCSICPDPPSSMLDRVKGF